jgi:hypothetical protein
VALLTKGPFEWHHAKGLETLCVRHAALGFAQALPGHPYEAVEPERPGQPRCDLMLLIADLAVEVRFLTARRPPEPANPKLLAPLLALSYAQNRAAAASEPRAAPAEQLAGFGAEGAGSVLYPLKEGVARGVDTEETLALVRGEHVVFVTKSFAKARTDWIGWTLFNQASTQSIVWDPARTPPVASVWPPSVFVEPGLAATPLPGPLEAMRAQLAGGAITPVSKEQLATALRRLFGGSEPLAQPVTPAMKRTYGDYLKASCDDRALWRLVDDGLAQVVHAYDLHGFAIVLWRELTPSATIVPFPAP